MSRLCCVAWARMAVSSITVCMGLSLQGVLEIAEDTGMGELLKAAGLPVEELKAELRQKLVRPSGMASHSAAATGANGTCTRISKRWGCPWRSSKLRSTRSWYAVQRWLSLLLYKRSRCGF